MMRRRKPDWNPKTKRRIAAFCAPVLALLCLALVFVLLDGLCMTRIFFGVPCPGCGMTRAVTAAVRGDFRAAFVYHPLWVTLPLLFVLLVRGLFPRFFDAVLDSLHIDRVRYLRIEAIVSCVLLVLFLAVYGIRLAGGWDGGTVPV